MLPTNQAKIVSTKPFLPYRPPASKPKVLAKTGERKSQQQLDWEEDTRYKNERLPHQPPDLPGGPHRSWPA